MKQHYIFITALFLMSSIWANAQNDTLEMQRNKNGKVNFARFNGKNNKTMKMKNAAAFLKATLKAKPEDSLMLVKEWIDDLGISHKKFHQYYKGIKVEHGDYLIHGIDDIDMMNGQFEKIDSLTVFPLYTESVALSNAINFVNATAYKWQNADAEAFLKRSTNNINATYYPVGELVICKDYLSNNESFKLAWKFMIASVVPDEAHYIFVDATNGFIINKESLMCEGNSPGTAQTLYSGSQNITGDSFIGGFRLRENRNGVDVQTLNIAKGSNYANAVDFVDNNNGWTAAEYANANQDQVALDVHWATEKILDYWSTVHNRNSVNGTGLPIKSYVHYGPVGIPNWNNARWDGVANVIQYGDGDGLNYRPLTSLDICAHEFGHGICQFTSNLALTANSESSALNEGFSDIWGAVIEAWAAPTKNNWVSGEEVILTGGTCMRSLRDPRNEGAERGPDLYQGAGWYAGPNPSIYSHTNLSILTHWFYCVAHGNWGWRDGQTSHALTGNGVLWQVYGIGINDAAKIAYRTELNLNSTANYNMVRNVSIQAARDLFGVGSCQEIATTNAWNAVGVGAAYSGGFVFPINGSNTICTSPSSNYTIPSLLTGATIVWSVSPSSIATPNTPNAIQTTLNKNGNGVITLTATINNACGTSGSIPNVNWQVVSTKQQIRVGTYTTSEYNITQYPSTVCNNGIVQVGMPWYYTPPAPNTTYNWYYGGGLTYISGQGTNVVTLRYNSQGPFTTPWVMGRANNDCGQGPFQTLNLSVNPNCYSSFAVSPNPSSDIINIEPNNDPAAKTTLKLPAEINQVELTDKMGIVRYRQKFGKSATRATINVSNLPSDIYTLRIFDGQIWFTHKVIIQH